MQIPEELKNTVVRIFGADGVAWWGMADQLLNNSIQKWNLANCRLAPELSINLVCFADSPAFGPVVLKLGVPNPELRTEIEALNLYQGRNICRCYDFDLDLGAMLLERIIPGPDLTMMSDTKERITVAAELIAQLPISVPDHHDLFPSFADWVRRAFERARRENQVGPRMSELIQAAEEWFPEILALNRADLLLHGDLHHKNILQDQHGHWKAIDPKGAIGPQCLEVGRFIGNQLEMTARTSAAPVDKENCMDEMVDVFSGRLGEPKRIIALCAFMDRVLSTCWSFESQDPPERLAEAVKECEFLREYVEG